MASASRDLKSRVTDLATCPICLELFNSPKSLPCLHTFCLKCIEGHCRDNEPGDEVVCPMCRQKFKIPDHGVQELVRNFIIADLVEARKTASDVVISEPCEVCLELDHSDQDECSVVASTMYCTDCNQKLCEQCSRPHRTMNGGPHSVVPIVSEVETKLIQVQLRGKCDKHKNDDVRMYCFDCKVNICLICFAEEHQQHKCNNVDTVAVECHKQIDADMELVAQRAEGARNEISRLDEERRKFLAGVEEVGEEIVKRGEELKQLILIDKQVNELMAEVQVLKTEKCKEIESHKENVERMLLAFETFSAYCSELKSNGKPCDITRAANDLHTRATELLQNDVTLTDYCASAVMFRPTNIHELLASGQNLVGVLVISNDMSESMPLVRVMSPMTEREKMLDQQLAKLKYKLLKKDEALRFLQIKCQKLRQDMKNDKMVRMDMEIKVQNFEKTKKGYEKQIDELRACESQLKSKLEKSKNQMKICLARQEKEKQDLIEAYNKSRIWIGILLFFVIILLIVKVTPTAK